MIDDILKQHQPGTKPRFFLHDEMKAWLCEHLDLKVSASVNHSIDYNLQTKLGLLDTLPVGHALVIEIELAGETIVKEGVNLRMGEYEQAFKCLANVSEQCMLKITQLEQENQDLKRRIELLENPLPV